MGELRFQSVGPELHTGHREQLFVYDRSSPLLISATKQVRCECDHSMNDGFLVFPAMYHDMSHPHHCGECSAMNIILTVKSHRLLGSLRSSIHSDRALNHTAWSSASKRVPCHLELCVTVKTWKMWKRIAQSLCKTQQGFPYP